MNNTVCGIKNELEYLENLLEQELVEWIRGFLAENRSEPLYLAGRDTYNSTILLQYYYQSSNSSFRRRFERSILKLADSWRESIDPLDYFAEILAVAGRIRIDDTYSRLLVLVKNENLKGQMGLGVDLHGQILRVLFGFSIDRNREDLEFIINRDIEDTRYAPLCFRRSWELDFRNGINNLPLLLRSFHKDKSIDIEGALERFLKKLGKNGFKKEFLNMLLKLSDPYYVDFLEILKAIGIEPRPSFINGKEGFVVDWREGDELSIFWIEIPQEVSEKLKYALESISYYVYTNGSVTNPEHILPESDAEFEVVVYEST